MLNKSLLNNMEFESLKLEYVKIGNTKSNNDFLILKTYKASKSNCIGSPTITQSD